MQFAANCRRSSWQRAVRANVPLNEEAIEAYDVLVANGVDAPVTDAPITALFRTTEDAEHMMRELRALEDAGQTMSVTALSGEALREQVPLASPAITAGAEHQRAALRRPRPIRARAGTSGRGPGRNDAHGRGSGRVQLRQRSRRWTCAAASR